MPTAEPDWGAGERDHVSFRAFAGLDQDQKPGCTGGGSKLSNLFSALPSNSQGLDRCKTTNPGCGCAVAQDRDARNIRRDLF